MQYISVQEYAKRKGVCEATVKNKCTRGEIEGAFKETTGRKSWKIPITEILEDISEEIPEGKAHQGSDQTHQEKPIN